VKPDLYSELVTSRKACRRCSGLTNPSVCEGGRLDSDHIGPWSRWQGNLDAQLMIVGQDWGDTRYLLQNSGLEKPGNPTNRTLASLLGSIGIEIGPPGDAAGADVVFFTNAFLCLKEGGLQGDVWPEWFANCSPYLRRQIEIISPKVVVGLGQRAYENVLRAFDFKPPPFRSAVEDERGTVLPTGARLFAAYHCGARIMNTHRPLSAQLRDWERIGRVLQG
jgi:uracil-DNA glycosylase family 4